MTSLEERLLDKGYANWLQVTYGLKCVKNGLCTVTEMVMEQFQSEILQENNISAESEACSNDSCSSKSIRQQGVGKFSCPNNVCSSLLKSIVEEHSNKKVITWENSDVRKWTKKCWEIAKVYMGHGQASTNTGPATTDCSGLLQLVRNCKQFKSKMDISPDTTDKVQLVLYGC